MMINLNQQFEILRMIEDGYLITKEKILQQFEISKKNVERAISSNDLSGIRYAGRIYFLHEQVALLVENLGEKENDANKK